jgi:hypothetical protein
VQATLSGPSTAELDWLARSGIQIPEGPDAGGVRAWLDETGGPPGFIYSEITGYFITLCCQLAAHGDRTWTARGERAATWIIERALHPSGAILSRKYDLAPERAATDPYSFENGRIAFFDCAMVGFGLVELHALTGNARWLDAATAIGGFLERAFADATRDGHSTFDAATMTPVAAAPRWSSHFGPFELKGAMFFDALASATGAAAPRAFVDRLITHALAQQHSTGRFPTMPAGDTTHLHPHTYTIEGLLYLAARHERRDLLQAAARGVDWTVTTCLAPTPQLQQWSEQPDLRIEGLRSDVLAQTLRAYEVIKLLAPETTWSWEREIPALHAQLDTFMLPSGGTAYGRDEYGARTGHANAWCHFFAVEAKLFRALRASGKSLDAASLIIT